MKRALNTLNWATTEMPTGKAQAALSKAYNEWRVSNEKEEDELIVFLVGCVTDGLLYGNWIGHTSEECFEMAQKREARRAAQGE
jgi:hypothetical protein